MREPRIRIERPAAGDLGAVREILADLPAWFGRPEATEAYVAAAGRLPGYVAVAPDGEPIGVVLVEQHFPETAEIHLMAVKVAWHRRGVGAGLLGQVESDLLARGTRMLTVKTLGQSHPDEGYRRTRLFYEAQGFFRLEELADLWPGTPCLFMAKPLF
ncbi:GNAT family N-acetyltransferase [Cellulomonas sp. 179-A 4D5 NHS]|uniref:GNAT family N-acetyltransferase n=1 Tax=Cellulomonas sp. 179-A 4D5 NHS TaxID=3142378 RepID=UPI0039A317C9